MVLVQQLRCLLLVMFAILSMHFILDSGEVHAQSIPFRHVILDNSNPRFHHCKAIGDIDGDGFPDVLAANASESAEGVFWLRYPDWTKHTIATGTFSTDMQVADIDGDGDLDVIIPRYFSNTRNYILTWFENPGPSGDPSLPWTGDHVIGTAASHDVEVADLNNDGKPDVVVRQDSLTIYFQITPDSWQQVTVNRRPYEGLALGDMDGDGDIDMSIGGYWLQNPLPLGNPATAPWAEYLIASGWPNRLGVHLADLNADGRLDVIVAPSESSNGRLSWYESTDPINGPWTEHIIDNTVSYLHTFKTADMDNDGDLDLVTAEMHQSSDPDEVSVYINLGNGLSWRQQVVATTGSHNIRVGDIGNDGDMDIVGANWSNAPPHFSPIEMWENLTVPPPPKLNLWQRHVIDPSRPWRSIFIDGKDLNGDGLKDIVTGGWWYRNPGSPGGQWVRSVVGSPMNNMAIVHDVDGDGDLDILGTRGQGSSANPAMAWAQNDGTGRFTVHTNTPSGSGDFLQGVAVTRLPPGAGEEVILSWHNGGSGIQSLSVPAQPVDSPWTIRTLSPLTQEEQVTAVDIDNDGDVDLVLGTIILRNDATAWTPVTIFPGSRPPDRNRVADMNRDGRLDVIIGYEAINVAGVLAWYEQPALFDQPWTEHVISSTVVGPMSLDVADLDLDGDIDVVVGEHNLADPSSARLLVWENVNGTGTDWRSHLIYRGDEHHDGAILTDIDNDGDLDILSIGWGHSRVMLYENKGNDAGGSTTPPAITLQPDNQGVIQGGDAAFFVSATGSPPLTYQWQRNGVEIPGATDALLVVQSATLADSGASFRCLVSNAYGSVVSGTARLTVSHPGMRVSAGQVVLYTFNERTGSSVRDRSQVGSPLDLVISDTSKTSWIDGALSVNAPTIISARGNTQKLQKSVSGTNEITLEAWVKTADFAQSGPARIVSFSINPYERNFTLGQGPVNGSTRGVDVRLRTSETSANGTPSLSTGVVLQNRVQHIVYTRNAAGLARILVDGVEKARMTIGGTHRNWTPAAQFVLANEATGDRPWRGEFHLVAVYNRALSDVEILHNRELGPNGADTVALRLPLRLYLEGPFDEFTGRMRTEIGNQQRLPLLQPYSDPLWGYTGNEQLLEAPGDMVDWVLVELRSGQAKSTRIATRAALLLGNGMVVDLNGTSPVTFRNILPGTYYVAVHHRNHLGVITAGPVQLNSLSAPLDFSVAMERAFGEEPMKFLSDGIFGLVAGDGNADGGVDILDKNAVWSLQNGSVWTYQKLADFNLDVAIDVTDLNRYWRENNGRSTQTPGGRYRFP